LKSAWELLSLDAITNPWGIKPNQSQLDSEHRRLWPRLKYFPQQSVTRELTLFYLYFLLFLLLLPSFDHQRKQNASRRRFCCHGLCDFGPAANDGTGKGRGVSPFPIYTK